MGMEAAILVTVEHFFGEKFAFLHSLFDSHASTVTLVPPPSPEDGVLSPNEAYTEEHFVDYIEDVHEMRSVLALMYQKIINLESTLALYSNPEFIGFGSMSAEDVAKLKEDLSILESKIVELDQLLAHMESVQYADKEGVGQSIRIYNNRNTVDTAQGVVKSYASQLESIQERIRLLRVKEI